jgi:hypothetical protein
VAPCARSIFGERGLHVTSQQLIDRLCVKELAGIALCAGLASGACAAPLSAHPIAVAVRHGDCNGAIDLANHALSSQDGQTDFLLGRMLDEGICVKQDRVEASRHFARGASLGDRSAALEYATKVGLGEGTEQGYERAGEICRSAGFDIQSRLSSYALGYACTLRGVASRLLRERLPKGAFRPNTGDLVIDFNPGSAAMSIRSTPQVGREAEAAIGYSVRKALVDAPRAIEDAWQSAVSVAPKPDATRLANQSVELSLDVDMTLEDWRKSGQQADSTHELRVLQPGDVRSLMR